MSDEDLSRRASREPPKPKPRRVYKTVSVDGPPYRVLLDGKAVSTPLRRPLNPPSRAIAEAIASEWDAQKEHVDPATMPVMRMISTCVDKVVDGRDALIDALLSHADADVICYRADHPADLKKRQAAVWDPILEWLRATHGVTLKSTSGLMPFTQAEDARDGLKKAFSALDDHRFTAAQAAAGTLSSLALALALVHGRLSAADALAASQLDETYQIEKWGEDKLAAARRVEIAAEVDGIGKFLKLLG